MARTATPAVVIDPVGSDMDIHLLSDVDGTACIERAHQGIATTLDAGTYYFSVDTFTSGGDELAAEYLFTVIAE